MKNRRYIVNSPVEGRYSRWTSCVEDAIDGEIGESRPVVMLPYGTYEVVDEDAANECVLLAFVLSSGAPSDKYRDLVDTKDLDGSEQAKDS